MNSFFRISDPAVEDRRRNTVYFGRMPEAGKAKVERIRELTEIRLPALAVAGV